jgi:hypothetical protein
LDLVLQPADDALEESKLPIMGSWADLRGAFGQMSVQLLKSVKVPIVRIEFGGILLAGKDTLECSYQQLKELLKSVDVDPRKMRDLHYRVNWRSDSKVVPLKLNRLTTWAAMRFTTKVIQLTGDKLSVAGGAGGERFAVRLEFDHNTDAANDKAFDPAKVEPIFQELVDLAVENAEKGEIVS